MMTGISFVKFRHIICQIQRHCLGWHCSWGLDSLAVQVRVKSLIWLGLGDLWENELKDYKSSSSGLQTMALDGPSDFWQWAGSWEHPSSALPEDRWWTGSSRALFCLQLHLYSWGVGKSLIYWYMAARGNVPSSYRRERKTLTKPTSPPSPVAKIPTWSKR